MATRSGKARINWDMRALVNRRRTATSAILAASLAVLAACNAKAAPTAAEPTPSPAGTEKVDRYQPGTILISDGSSVVTIGDKQITFPTTVKDAVWSPDGSRIAFIDGEGRLATAHPDGTSIVYPAGSDKTGRIERPAWFGPSILATGWNGKQSLILRRNATDSASQWQTKDWNRLDDGGDWPQGDVRDPSATYLADQDERSGVVAFEHDGAKGDEVWVLDYNQREPFSVKIADGSEPAISPDGTKVAYVGRNGQIQVAPAVGMKHTAKQVTFGAATPSHLVWTADGARIAYSTPQGVQSVAAIPVGSKSNPATSLTSKPASVSFLLGRANQVDSLIGDPVAAALKASQLRWPIRSGTYGVSEDNGPAEAVVIASSAEPDIALAASQVTRSAHGPLLLTTGQDLDPAVRDEVRRVLGKVEGRPARTMVYLVGKLSASAEKELRALGYSTEHFTGTPAAVSLAGAKAWNPIPDYDPVMVVESSNTTGAALSIADGGMATLLTDGDKLSSQAHAYVDVAAVHGKVYALGDKARAAVRPTRISDLGVDSSSSVAYAQHFTVAPLSAVVVDSDDPRMLAIAVSLALSTGSPLLMAADQPVAYLDKTSGVTDRVYVVGSGTSGLTAEITEAIG